MEIELKFLIQPELITDFKDAISQSPYQLTSQPSRQLSNAYFDTPEQTLRSWDFGLRTRGSVLESGETWTEQTVKLAGQDIGGLHQRPEYTIELADCQFGQGFADLTLFETSIWPDGFSAQMIQPQLAKLFETRFQRDVWLVTMPSGSVIELVLDQGQVLANETSETISEIELELVSGQVEDVFALAQYIASKVNIKLGLLSKAARGYYLAADQELECRNLEDADFNADTKVEIAFIRLLTNTLEFIQHHEVVLSRSHSLKALRRIVDGISMLVHVLKLFAPYLPNSQCEKFMLAFKAFRKRNAWVEAFYQLEQLHNRKSPYRNDIERSTSLRQLLADKQLPDAQMEQAMTQFAQHEFNQLMLSFIQWLNQKQWRSEMPLSKLSTLNKPIENFSALWLDNAWDTLKEGLCLYKDQDSTKHIVKAYWPLTTELLTGLCVGSLYPMEERQPFRNRLVDLLLGFEELMLLNVLQDLIEQQDAETNVEHQTWLQGKQQSLSIALSASVDQVLKLKPYW